MTNKIILSKKSLKSALLATIALLPLGGYAKADIIDGRFGVSQVFDVQRNPAFPTANAAFNLSNFVAPLRDNASTYDIGTGYIGFFYSGDANNLVGIRRYDNAGNLMETISSSGDIYGLEQDGFLYVSTVGDYGTFVSNNQGFTLGDSVSYTTTQAGVYTLEQLMAYVANSRILANGEIYNPPGTQLSDAAVSSGNNPGLGAAASLDLFSANTSDTQLQNALNALSSTQERSEAVTQTLPVVTGATNYAVMGTISNTSQIVQARINGQTGLSTGDEGIETDGNIWFKPFYSGADQDNKNAVTGYKTDSYGIVGGIDAAVTDNLRLGTALSFATTDIEGNDDRHDVDVKSYELIGYGSYALGAATEANFIAGGGYFTNDSSRRIDFGGLNRIANADYDSWSARIGAGIGRVYSVTPTLELIPAARVDYTYIKNEAYTENGAGTLNLDMDSQSTDQLIPQISGKARYKLQGGLTLEGNIGVGYDLLSDQSSTTATFAGGGPAFITDGIDPSPWNIESGVGLNYRVNESLDLHVNYDRMDRGSDFNTQTVSAKMKLAF